MEESIAVPLSEAKTQSLPTSDKYVFDELIIKMNHIIQICLINLYTKVIQGHTLRSIIMLVQYANANVPCVYVCAKSLRQIPHNVNCVHLLDNKHISDSDHI